MVQRPLARIEQHKIFEAHENIVYLPVLAGKIGRSDLQEVTYLHLCAVRDWLAKPPYSIDAAKLTVQSMRELGVEALPDGSPWAARRLEWVLLDPDRAARVSWARREIIKLVTGFHYRCREAGWSFEWIARHMAIDSPRVRSNFETGLRGLGDEELCKWYSVPFTAPAPAAMGWAERREANEAA